MISAEEFLASKRAEKFPNWIKQHPNWKDYPLISKVFPDLGLKNCREPYPVEIMDYGTSNIGVPTKMEICFSSDGVKGMWDIATMSMRGALSCRHWENPHAKASYNLVADSANPLLGIIYFTDGSMTEYGVSINKRALVRYCPPWTTCAAHIVLDRVYAKTTNRDPLQYLNQDPDSTNTREIFKSFLKSKLNNKAKANVVVR